MTRTLRAFLLLAALAPVGGAAAQDSIPPRHPAAPAAPDRKDPSQPTKAPLDEGAIIPAGPTVKPLDAGQGEKHTLRYHTKVGDITTATMTMKMGMAITMGENQMPARDMPPVVMTFELRTAAVNGPDSTIEMRVREARVEGDDPMVEQLAEMLEPLKGLKGRHITSDRGLARSMTLDIPEGLPPMVAGMMDRMKHDIENFSAPLPEEPVGLGAKWETRSHVSEPIAMDRVGASTLDEVSPEGFRLSLTVTGSAEPQDLHAPGMPEGVTARVKSMKLSGTGALRGRFDLLMPAEATMKSEQEGAMTISQGEGQTTEMTQRVTLEMTIAAHPGTDSPKAPGNPEAKPESKPETKPEKAGDK
jgi:hypothetical protein